MKSVQVFFQTGQQADIKPWENAPCCAPLNYLVTYNIGRTRALNGLNNVHVYG